jgi:DNA-binding FrmR family transcriptional regulator
LKAGDIMQCDSDLINRLKRANGQMKGVLSMMESDTECMDLLTQLKAIRASIDKTIGLLTTENLLQTIEKSHGVKLDRKSGAIDLVVKGK